MQSVIIYTKPNCMQCDMTKKAFNAKGIKYETEDILDPDNLAAVQSLGLGAAPVIVVSQGKPGDEVYWAGFQPMKIAEHIKPNQ